MLFFACFFLRPVNQDGYVKATKKTDGQRIKREKEKNRKTCRRTEGGRSLSEQFVRVVWRKD